MKPRLATIREVESNGEQSVKQEGTQTDKDLISGCVQEILRPNGRRSRDHGCAGSPHRTRRNPENCGCQLWRARGTRQLTYIQDSVPGPVPPPALQLLVLHVLQAALVKHHPHDALGDKTGEGGFFLAEAAGTETLKKKKH